MPRKKKKEDQAPLFGLSYEPVVEPSVSQDEPGIRDRDLPEPKTVASYLADVNDALRPLRARVTGEISSVSERGRAVYFSLKDATREAVLPCFMWSTDLRTCGVSLAEGLQVIVEGYPELYVPYGKFSFRADTVELVGEGALKKAYDALKQKLEGEGLFSPERKRPLPLYPQTIGVITSREGAVIHDFLQNIGRYGFKILFRDARVEGQRAVPDLLAAIRLFEGVPLDALVIIRGGGSLESLQAFNNEALVRAVVSFPHPVICGIGHDKDVTLAALAADYAPSTPTAAAELLNDSWDRAEALVRDAERTIIGQTERVLESQRFAFRDLFSRLMLPVDRFLQEGNQAFDAFRAVVPRLGESVVRSRDTLADVGHSLLARGVPSLAHARTVMQSLEQLLLAYNPETQLARGYAIPRVHGKILRSVSDAHPGDPLALTVRDGTVVAEVQGVRHTDSHGKRKEG
jgi:exodeoxyribonuclease VII large subunit